MAVALGFKRNENESYRDCVIRYGEKYGLKDEVLTLYDDLIDAGKERGVAAFDALYDWDVLDLIKTDDSE